ncbi:MAG: phage tail protein [Clostridia bacterium]|nr:phage tail protein [Clostridia bacterium]
MIRLYDGEILDLLPPSIKDDTEVKCISYAIKAEFRRIMDEADRTLTMAMIDAVSEDVLDVLAVELRSPFYLESMDIEVKRGIIKNTLLWYMHAGTPNAVADMVQTIFGEGEVVEWFDFEDGEGEPGTFDIITNAWMSEDILEQFVAIIKRVKNTRSHIRGIAIRREYDIIEYAASGAVTMPSLTVLTGQQERDAAIRGAEHAAAGTSTHPHVFAAGLQEEGKARVVEGDERAAPAAQSMPCVAVTNNGMAAKAQTAEMPMRVAAAIICMPAITAACAKNKAISPAASPRVAAAAHGSPKIRIA